MIDLPPGDHDLEFRIGVTDQTRKVEFPLLPQGEVTCTIPPKQKYRIEVRDLVLVSSNYDTQVEMFGNKKPDPKWYLQIGRDIEFASIRIKNSLVAATGATTLTLSEGDEVNLALYDDDRGLFNRDDFLGNWRIQIPEDGEGEFVVTQSGLIERMKISISPR